MSAVAAEAILHRQRGEVHFLGGMTTDATLALRLGKELFLAVAVAHEATDIDLPVFAGLPFRDNLRRSIEMAIVATLAEIDFNVFACR